jgi:hypothetical protein
MTLGCMVAARRASSAGVGTSVTVSQPPVSASTIMWKSSNMLMWRMGLHRKGTGVTNDK